MHECMGFLSKFSNSFDNEIKGISSEKWYPASLSHLATCISYFGLRVNKFFLFWCQFFFNIPLTVPCGYFPCWLGTAWYIKFLASSVVNHWLHSKYAFNPLTMAGLYMHWSTFQILAGIKAWCGIQCIVIRCCSLG